MNGPDARFEGSIPEFYDSHLVPYCIAPFADDLASRVAKFKPEYVLEVACGTGALTRVLRVQTPTATRIIATDLVEDMLSVARTMFSGDDTIEFRQADAIILPFDAGKFDLVVCQFGVMFFPDKQAAVREALRVLKPGGWFVFNVFDDIRENAPSRIVHELMPKIFPDDPPRFMAAPFSFHSHDAITQLLDESGFIDVSLDVVRLELELPSASIPAIGQALGGPLANEIRARNREPREIVDELTAALAAECGDAPFRYSLQAIFVSAQRP